MVVTSNVRTSNLKSKIKNPKSIWLHVQPFPFSMFSLILASIVDLEDVCRGEGLNGSLNKSKRKSA